MSDEPLLRFRYRNWRGEEADRTVRPIRVRFGECEFHPGPQWLLDAFDTEKGAERTFAFSGILGDAGHPLMGHGMLQARCAMLEDDLAVAIEERDRLRAEKNRLEARARELELAQEGWHG